MLFLIAILILGGATVGSVLAYQRGAHKRLAAYGDLKRLAPKPEPEPEPEPTVERSIETLSPSDVVVHDDRDWLIVGSLNYREEDDTWHLHHLEDAGESCWLEVRKRQGNWQAAMLKSASGIPTFGRLGDGLTYQGMPYRLLRRGVARVVAVGDTRGRKSETVEYTTYDGAGVGYLVVEQTSSGRVANSGEYIREESLDLLPGSGLLTL